MKVSAQNCFNWLNDEIIFSSNTDQLSQDPSLLVTNLSQVNRGTICLAYKGVRYDPHSKLNEVLDQSLIICEHKIDSKSPYLVVKNARRAWAIISSKYYKDPQKSLTMIGITGTNGKTSSVWFLKDIFFSCNEPVATIGTLGCYIGDKHISTSHTTPDPPELYRLLSQIQKEGIKYVAMEVSSIAIDQEKLFPIEFDAVAMTSFSQDHLDYHGTMEKYFSTKLRLFNSLVKTAGYKIAHASIHNIDAPKYSVDSELKFDGNGLIFNFEKSQITLKAVGEHFAANAWCALSISNQYLKLPNKIEISGSPGRMEVIANGIYVDYAHTPDALKVAILAIKKFCKGKLITVFGCGGDRDKEKRKLMGEISDRFSDMSIITNDNPRNEDPRRIASDISIGMKGPFQCILDRKSAIQTAIELKCEDDMILIAGKGHEPYMEINGEKIEFDDREVIRKILS